MKALILSTLVLFGLNSFAAKGEISSISCKAKYKADEHIFVQLSNVNFEAGTIARSLISFAIPDGGENWGIVPDVSTASISREALTATPYKGRNYPNHKKFDLLRGAKSVGNFRPDSADLIISPEYKVVKTIPQQNNWDKTWTWDVEVRQHSSVLAANYSDHHGDYIQLDCYSTGIVNDSKRRN